MLKQSCLFRILSLILILFLLILPVFATTTESTAATTATTAPAPDNVCGDGITWIYNNGILTITGAGKMYDFTDGAPWDAYRDSITDVVFIGGVTYVGAYAFKNYDTLTTISFGTAMYEIGTEAFASCDGLTEVSLPYAFKVFGPSCFQNCKNLKAFHCAGRFPSFRQNCLWDTYATLYYPADNPWSLEYIDQLEAAFRGRIQFLASDGTDPHGPQETTAATTEAPTEPSTEVTTEATTEATTAPTTAPSTQPTTPATTQPEQTLLDPTPVQDPDAGSARQILLIVSLLVAIVFTLLALAILIAQYCRQRKIRRRRQRRNAE